MRLQQQRLQPVYCIDPHEEKAANEHRAVVSGLQGAPAAVIHSALNLNLNLNCLIKHPAVQTGKKGLRMFAVLGFSF